MRQPHHLTPFALPFLIGFCAGLWACWFWYYMTGLQATGE